MKQLLPGLALLFLAGCASETSVTTDPPPSSTAGDDYLIIDLTTRASSTTDVEPSYVGLGSRLVLRKTVVGGSLVYVAPILVTEAQWQAAVPGRGRPWTLLHSRYRPSNDTPDHPAYGLSQDDAAAFATAVSTIAGRTITVITPDTWSAISSPAQAEIPLSPTFSDIPWAYTAEAARTTGPRIVGSSAGNDAPGGWRDAIGNLREWLSDGRLAGPSWMDPLTAWNTSYVYDGVPPTSRHPLAGTRVQASYP